MNPHAISTRTSDQSAKLYAAAHLIALAEGYGARIAPTVNAYSSGSTDISVRLNNGECHVEIAAWQFATDQVWDVSTIHWGDADDPQVTRATNIDVPTPFGPQRLRLMFSYPALRRSTVGVR